MDQLTKETNKTIEHINLLTDSVSLNQKIVEITSNPLLHKIFDGIDEANHLIKTAQKLVRHDLALVRREYDKAMRDLRETQTEILNYLVKIKKRKIAEQEDAKTPLHRKTAYMHTSYKENSQIKVPNSIQKSVHHSALKQMQLKFGDLAMTPNKASPLVKKINFVLPDFDVQITPQQFESIPKYMRGRTSHDELQYFLENTIAPCFYEKYKLIHRSRAAVQHTKDFEIWKLYHAQISYVQGRNFITAGDISRKMKKMIDKKTQNYIIMLRHLGILQEQRVSQTICYIWAAT